MPMQNTVAAAANGTWPRNGLSTLVLQQILLKQNICPVHQNSKPSPNLPVVSSGEYKPSNYGYGRPEGLIDLPQSQVGHGLLRWAVGW